MTARVKLPTRRELRATLLETMARTLENDTVAMDAEYCYAPDGATPAQDEQHRERLQAVAANLAAEWMRRAERLRK